MHAHNMHTRTNMYTHTTHTCTQYACTHMHVHTHTHPCSHTARTGVPQGLAEAHAGRGGHGPQGPSSPAGRAGSRREVGSKTWGCFQHSPSSPQQRRSPQCHSSSEPCWRLLRCPCFRGTPGISAAGPRVRHGRVGGRGVLVLVPAPQRRLRSGSWGWPPCPPTLGHPGPPPANWDGPFWASRGECASRAYWVLRT